MASVQQENTQNSTTVPNALPMDGININTALGSDAIDKTLPRTSEQILNHLPQTHKSNAGKMAVHLACQFVFEVGVMRRCTPLGAGKLPGLLVRELQCLKQLILEHFPETLRNLRTLKKCQTALEHSFSSLRSTATS